jgi:uncharacterized protein
MRTSRRDASAGSAGDTSELRFYAELNDFLPPPDRFRTIQRVVDRPTTVKDLIESAGVPHTEVDLVTVNGESVDLRYRVAGGDRIAVYPVFEAFDISPIVRVRPEPLRDPRFVLDGHLAALARHLRLLGFDTLCEPGWDDARLAAVSGDERRILLTRDVGLLKRRAVTHGCFVRAVHPRRQIVEIARRLQLLPAFRPFTRCLVCNGLLAVVAKQDVAGEVDSDILRRHDEFIRCGDCRRVYWRGSHYQRLSALVHAVRAELSVNAGPVL